MKKQKNKPKKVFNFKGGQYGHRPTDCVKICFYPHEMLQRPIKYWADLISGRTPKSKLIRVMNQVKEMVDSSWANSIIYLTYDGSVHFSYSLQWWADDTEFELSVGTLMTRGLSISPHFHIRRKVGSKYERFTAAEMKALGDFLREQTLYVHRAVLESLKKDQAASGG